MFIIQLQNGLNSHQLLLNARSLDLVSIHVLKHSDCVGGHGTHGNLVGNALRGSTHCAQERIFGVGSPARDRSEERRVGKDWFDGTPCERYVNCGNPFCNRRILASEDNEDKYLRGCSHECRVHPRNRYVLEHELTQDQVIERLAAIGESLDHSEVV